MIKLTPGQLTLSQRHRSVREAVKLRLDPASFAAIDAWVGTVAAIMDKGKPAYDIPSPAWAGSRACLSDAIRPACAAR